MKKILISIASLLSILFLFGCDFNAPLRNQMLAYYGNDDNYAETVGTVKSTRYKADTDELFIEMKLNENGVYEQCINAHTGFVEFVLVNFSNYEIDLNVGDTASISSAPMYFYNDHIMPIVALSEGDTEYISFEEGKNAYLFWIEETFSPD